MNEDVKRQVEEYIGKYFYYIEYPPKAGGGFWRDTDGKRLSIMVMNKGYLEKCLIRVNTDLQRFEGCQMNPVEQQALEEILPLVYKIKNDIQEELQYQGELEHEEAKVKVPDYVKQEIKEKQIEKKNILIPETIHKKTTPEKPEEKAPEGEKRIDAYLPIWMIDKLQAEGDIGAVLKKYLLKSGLSKNNQNIEVSKPDNPKEIAKNNSAKPTDSQKPKLLLGIPTRRILNNSLNAILGFVQLALSYDWPKETMIRYLKSIEKTTHRMKNEISNLNECEIPGIENPKGKQ